MSKQDSVNVEVNEVADHLDISRQTRRQRIANRRANRAAGGLGWIAGALLIAIGVLLLLQTSGLLPPLTNWWALFLLLPAVGCFSAALGVYRRDGSRRTGESLGLLVAGLLFTGLAAVFFFELNIAIYGPIFMIVAGLLLLLRLLV